MEEEKGVRGRGWGSEGYERGVVGGRVRCERVGLEEEKGCEGTGGVGMEKGKGCEGKVKWGWKEGVGLEGAESEEGRGRTTRINLKI